MPTSTEPSSASTSTPISAALSNGSASAEQAVHCRDVRKSFPRTRSAKPILALDGVSLDIPPGEFLALLGPNGSGKSTLLKCLATIQRPDSGEVRVHNRAMTGPDASAIALRLARSEIGVAFQSPALDPLLTIRENLVLAGAMFGINAVDADNAAAQIAGALSLSDRLGDRVKTLSGGLTRRADLARAMLHRPRLLLLDEPTAGLDLRARAEFFAALAEARRLLAGLTIVMTTHQMDEAERADRAVLMHKGKIVADGSPMHLRQALGGTVLRCTPGIQGAATTTASAAARDGNATNAVPAAHAGIIANASTAAAETASGSVHPSASADTIRAALARASMHITDDPSGDGTILARASNAHADITPLIAELLKMNVPVQIGPPTLADVYLARTGQSLAAANAEVIE